MVDFQLAEQAARAYVGEREWQKGRPYVAGLTTLTEQPDGQNLVLQGRAHGQEKYTVNVTLHGQDIVTADCDCPVGSGACKHVAALLARAAQSPQDFRELPDLGSVLDSLDAPELRKLVRRMLEREPSLMSVVLTGPRKTGVNGSSDLRQRIQDAFSLLDYDPEEDWEGEGPDLSDLYPLVEEAINLLGQAESLSEQGRADLLEALLAVLTGCAELDDDHYDLGLDDLYQPARTGVLKLLHLPMDEHTRENALDGLMESIGNLGWNRGEFDSQDQFELFADLPVLDRQMIIQFVRGVLDAEKSSYGRTRWAKTLFVLTAEEPLSFEEELNLARATEDQQNVVEVLFKHDRIEEAITALSAGGRSLAPQQVEQYFAERNLLPRLEEYARQNLKVFGSRAWLYGRYRDTGRRAEAHALAKDAVLKGTGDHEDYTSFHLTRDLDWLQQLKVVSPDWPADREEYIRKLWKSAQFTDLLMRFLLTEKLLDRAEELVNRQGQPVSPAFIRELALQLPVERAKPLLLKAAVDFVANGNRTQYAQAAQTLAEGAAIIGRSEAQAMARLLLQENPRLRALPDELKKAGLI